MHRATLLSHLLALLLSYVHLSSAQNYASISLLEQSDSSTTISLSEDGSSTSSSPLDNSSSLPTGTTESSTITLPPQFSPTYPPGLITDEHDLINIPSVTNSSSTLTVLDEVTTDPTLVPSNGVSPSSFDDENTWFTPPPVSANLPSPPSSASTLSIYADGPVSYCKTINVWWAGGVSPYNIYYMLLEPNQTVSDYTVEYTVGTKTSYGPVYIVQLGDSEMQMGQKRRGLTRIRIQDAAGTSKMTWVQNLEPDPHAPCGVVLGASTPKPPQSTMSTVKFDDHITIGSGTQLTTAVVVTIDGQPTTIFPSVTQGNRPSNVAQPGSNVSTGSGAPPRQTGGMPSGPIVHGSNGDVNVSSIGSGSPSGNTPGGSNSFNGNASVSGVAASNPQPGRQSVSSTIVQNSVHSSGNSGSRSTTTASIRGQVANPVINSPGHGSSTNRASNTLSVNRSNVSGTSHSSSIPNTSQSGTSDNQASSIIRGDETTNSISSSSSTIVPGVANAANETGSGKENYIVIRLSSRVFALIVALLVSAVLACAGAAFFIHRKRSLRKSESHDHLF